jgi:hypothetical protein
MIGDADVACRGENSPRWLSTHLEEDIAYGLNDGNRVGLQLISVTVIKPALVVKSASALTDVHP